MPLPLSSAVQDAASKKSNNLLLDTSDLSISQYSLLGQTPPRSAPGSPAIHARDSSAAPSEEAALVVEEGGQTATADVGLQSDPDLNADAKSDPSATQSSDQSTVLLSPVIIVSQESDESSPEEPSCFEETREEVQLGTDVPSPTAESDAGHEVCTPKAPADPPPTDPNPDSPDLSVSTLSSPQAADVPAECAQSDQPAAPENSATPDLSTPDQAASSYPPCTDSPMKISLGSLSEAIGCNSTAPSVMLMTQQTTDRAVYLTGEMKKNWEVERVKEKKQTEAAEEKEAHEKIKEGNEETEAGERKEEQGEGERAEGQTGGEAQTGGEPVDEGCQSSESPAESATALTIRQRECEDKADEERKGSELETEKRTEDEEKAEERDHEEKAGDKEKEEEELLQSPQSLESQPESDAELPLDSVAVIRELVTEITEVETEIRPCPNSSHAP